MKQDAEYLLYVWNKKPEDLKAPPHDYWKAHIINAPKIPTIGESIESIDGIDDYNKFRVFEVRNRIRGGLAHLITENKFDTILLDLSKSSEKNILPIIYAYLEI